MNTTLREGKNGYIVEEKQESVKMGEMSYSTHNIWYHVFLTERFDERMLRKMWRVTRHENHEETFYI